MFLQHKGNFASVYFVARAPSSRTTLSAAPHVTPIPEKGRQSEREGESESERQGDGEMEMRGLPAAAVWM